MKTTRSWTAADLPDSIPVFPLPGVLLLPRVELPLNIFEPRYLAMVDDALRGNRLIGMIQPRDATGGGAGPLMAVGGLGRITAFAETGDGRYLITLAGLTRFGVLRELAATTPYRQCQVEFASFANDFVEGLGQDQVDRNAILKALADFAEARSIQIDWDSLKATRNESLVNHLSMMAPFGPREKQALLEAPDARTRAEVLVAVTELELARNAGAARPLQ